MWHHSAKHEWALVTWGTPIGSGMGQRADSSVVSGSVDWAPDSLPKPWQWFDDSTLGDLSLGKTTSIHMQEYMNKYTCTRMFIIG